MTAQPVPTVISADRLEDGVIVTFDDGKTTIYSAALLHSIRPLAEPADDRPKPEGYL